MIVKQVGESYKDYEVKISKKSSLIVGGLINVDDGGFDSIGVAVSRSGCFASRNIKISLPSPKNGLEASRLNYLR